MFSPVFQITNKTLLALINVEVNKKIVELAVLQPDWENRLKTENLAKRTYSIFHFLENGLKLDDIVRIVKDEPGRDDKPADVALRCGVVGKERDVQLVLNFLNANKLAEQVAYLTNKFKQTDYGIKELVSINTLVGERLVPAGELGAYRKSDDRDSRLGVPLAVEVPYQIEDLFNWFGSSGKNEIHPILKAGVMFFELIRIMPFASNNLVTSLCFVYLILLSEGYQIKQLWALEEEMLKNREAYRTAIESVGRNGGEISVWLEIFSRWVDDSVETTKTRVVNLVGSSPILKSDGGRVISLTEREIVIMEEMNIKGETTIKEIRSILPLVSDDTILRDLKDLIDKKLIRKKGKTKGAVYVMGKVKSYR